MILTCPNCATRYNLPEEKIPAGGAKVKCSKCGQVFKAELPPETPEEEVEALLDEESGGGDTQAGEAFEETFENVAATAETAEEPPAEQKETPVPEPGGEAVSEPEDEPVGEDDFTDDLFDDVEEDEEGEEISPDDGLPDTDDLFDESEDETPAPEEGPVPSDATEEDLSAGDLFEDEDDDESGDDLFADEDEDSDDDLFADEDANEDEDKDEDDTFGNGLELDDIEDKGKGSRRSLGCLIAILVLALILGAAIYFKAWTAMGINLGDMLKNVPFVGQMFMEETGSEDTEPGESPAERVRKIELKNVKQYYVANEKAGNLFVVEGKAVNKFAKPKERIKVEVILYDGTNNVLTSQAFLCGNVLSQFQLQVQSEKEIKEGLTSEVGILSNNTFIRPGASTPFMAVFFTPPAGVKEFMVKVVDVGDPK